MGCEIIMFFMVWCSQKLNIKQFVTCETTLLILKWICWNKKFRKRNWISYK